MLNTFGGSPVGKKTEEELLRSSDGGCGRLAAASKEGRRNGELAHVGGRQKDWRSKTTLGFSLEPFAINKKETGWRVLK